jgi:serine/threonine-protein kinase
MENQQPLSKPGASSAAPKTAPPADTKLAQHTPEEHDPLWAELGATHVTDAQNDSSVHLDRPANPAEPSALRMPGKSGVMLGDYQLVRKLGEGAMGAVYKAKQVCFNGEELDQPRTVALKILFPHVAKIKKLVDRLRREGEVMGLLSHPNIVQAYAIGEADGCHYVAMEYVSGRSLQKWLAELGRLPVADAVRITLDCARALEYAHAQNVIHRDIKPDNVLLAKVGVVKVADLGMVKIDDEEMSLTQTGHAVGTPWYMPLEQARNAKEIDGRSDIYALGCTLYAMLTGHPPFTGRTIVEVIQAKEIGTFPPARQQNSHVPERLDLLIAKMTAKLPKYRFQTAGEVIKALESLELAGEALSFLPTVGAAPQLDSRVQETPAPGKTTVIPLRAPLQPYAELERDPEFDPDQWYVQTKKPDGTPTAQKYTTAQLQKMLAEGTMKPTARASHDPSDGFRSLATYKEFQGTALSQLSKKAADKSTAKYRGIYKKIEEADRELAVKEREASVQETSAQANTRYWAGIFLKFLPLGIVILALIIGMYFISKYAL